MKIKEIRELGENAAAEKLSELRAELAKEKALVASGTRSEKPARIRKTRKTIARLLTIMRENQMAKETRGKPSANVIKRMGKQPSEKKPAAGLVAAKPKENQKPLTKKKESRK